MKPIQNNPVEVSGKGDGDCFLLPVGIPKGMARGGDGQAAGYIILRGGELFHLTPQQLSIWNDCWNLAPRKNLILHAIATLSIAESDIQNIIEALVNANLLLPISETKPWNELKFLRPVPLTDVPELGDKADNGQMAPLKDAMSYYFWLRFDGRTTLETMVGEFTSSSKDISPLQAELACLDLLFLAVKMEAVLLDS